jgi:hypothetical protein
MHSNESIKSRAYHLWEINGKVSGKEQYFWDLAKEQLDDLERYCQNESDYYDRVAKAGGPDYYTEEDEENYINNLD